MTLALKDKVLILSKGKQIKPVINKKYSRKWWEISKERWCRRSSTKIKPEILKNL